MHNTIIRASGIDCVALVLWLTSIALFGHLVAHGSDTLYAVGAILAGIGGATTWVAAVIRRVEERVTDQMTIEHRAQSGEVPTILSSVR